MRHIALDLEVLEDCLDRQSSAPESAWEDLAALVPYLDDHLVLKERAKIFEGGACNLTVFLANDDEKTPLYVLVDSQGVVRVGRTDRLSRCAKLHLGEFDRLWHGVLSVAVTGRQRLLGTRQDLWIVVRRKDDEVVVYHGLVDLDEEGNPVLEPAVDDWGGGDHRVWRAGKAKSLPDWLSCCSFTCPPDVDPFEGPPEAIQSAIRKADGDPAQQVEMVYWTGDVLALCIGHEVQLHGLRRVENPGRLDLGERVRTVALTRNVSGGTRGIAAPDSHRLRAFENTAELWRQWTHEFPVALAFMPAGEAGVAWPDLLVAFQDGELHRLTYAGKDRLRTAWSTAWSRLLPEDTTDLRISAARQVQSHEQEGVRRAALIGVVEKVIAEAPLVRPQVREKWLEEMSLLFRPAERFGVLSEPLRLLLNALERSLFQESSARPLKEETRFLAALIHRLYTGQLYLAMQDQVDEAFRVMKLSQEHLADSSLRELAARSIQNREEIWREPRERNRPQDLIERSIFGLERWANAYLPADAEQIATSRREVLTGVAALHAPPGETGPWVAFGRREELRVYSLDSWSRLSRPLDVVPLNGASVQDIISTGETDLVVARSSGELSVWQVDTEADPPALVRREVLDLSNLGVPWGLARCDVAGRPVIAAVCNRRRISTVVLCSAGPEGLREIAQIPLDLPRVRSLDLSVDEAGNFLLAAGSVHTSPVRIYRIDPMGEEIEKRWLRVLESGTSAVRFSSAFNPDLLLAGERNGLLWCCDLTSTSDISDLLWTYELGGAIRAIEPVLHEGQSRFLAGSENGKLVLLDGRTGRRVWKYPLPGAIRQVQRDKPGRIIVTLRSGRAIILSQVEDREASLQEVRKCLTALGPGFPEKHKDLWETATAEPLQALFRLLVLEDREVEVLRRFPAREARARVVRYLAEQVPPSQLRDRPEAIVRELSWREMALVSVYRPNAAFPSH